MEETLREISAGQVELISLIGCSLTTAGLHSVVSALQNGDCSANLVTMNLSNNALTNEACALLHSALQNPSFCPSLLTLNLQDNPGLDEGGQGVSILQQMVSLRPDLQVIRSPQELRVLMQVLMHMTPPNPAPCSLPRPCPGHVTAPSLLCRSDHSISD